MRGHCRPVSAQLSAAVEPGDRSLDEPALGRRRQAFRLYWRLSFASPRLPKAYRNNCLGPRGAGAILGRGLRLFNRLRRHSGPIRRPRALARPVSCASPPESSSRTGTGSRTGLCLRRPGMGVRSEPIPVSNPSRRGASPKPCRLLKTSRPSPFFSVSTRPREGLKRPLPSARQARVDQRRGRP